MRHVRSITALAVLFTAAQLATAAPTVDGTRDAEYGPALAVQTVQTQFGDNESEWNAAYATLDGGFLYLMLTGNLQNNFNKLDIFIDSKAGGQSVFDSSGNDNAQNMDGLTFDTGFTADYHLIARRGSGKFDFDFANLGAQSASGYFDLFAGADFGSGSTGTGVNASPILASYNGSNTAGVTGGTAAADQAAAAAVTTGLELRVALSDLGYTTGPLHIMVGQNNGDHNYWSNQFLGGLTAPQGNLGGDGAGGFTGEGAIDFNLFSENQYFTVPEPATLALLGACVPLLATRRRR
jgi:hypothetical protein